MKKDNINYFLVGCFVLLTFLLLIVALIQITGRTEKTVEYIAYYQSITGLKFGSTITYGGYNIGYVSDIIPMNTIDKGTKFKVVLSILENWAIPADSFASIVQPNLLSENQIEITEGSSNIALKKGAIIASKDAVSLSKVFGDLSADIKPLITTLNSGLGIITNDLATKFPKITDNLNNLLTSLQQNSEQLTVLTNKNRSDKILNIIENADNISLNLLKISNKFIQSEKQLSEIINTSHELVIDNKHEIKSSILGLTNTLTTLSENVNAIIHNIDSASRNVNEFTRQIRNNPSVILTGGPPEDHAELK